MTAKPNDGRSPSDGEAQHKTHLALCRLPWPNIYFEISVEPVPVRIISFAYLRERLEAFKGLSLTTFSAPLFTWVARLHEPFFHFICGSGHDWQ
jgi:hypothetical protein